MPHGATRDALAASVLLGPLLIAPVSASTMAALRPQALQCLQAGQPAACRSALLLAETLQRRASARNAFPCQTLLLGLQADLIMEQLGAGRGEKAIADVSAAGRGCAGL